MPAKKRTNITKPDLAKSLDIKPAPKKKTSKSKADKVKKAITKTVEPPKTPQETGAMGGRPPIELDETQLKQLKQLAMMQCPKVEIAATLGISVATLDRRFDDIVEDARNEGKALIRKYQFETAKKGNATILKFLGTNYLAQKDRDIPDDGPRNLAFTSIHIHPVEAPGRQPIESTSRPTASSDLGGAPLEGAVRGERGSEELGGRAIPDHTGDKA